MRRPTFYMDYKVLVLICEEEKKYSIWHKIIHNHVEIHISPIGTDNNEDLEVIDAFDNASRTANLTIEQEFFDRLESQDLSKYPRDVFIIDVTEEKANELSENFGVLVLSSTNFSNFNIKGISFERDIGKNRVYEKVNADGNKLCGWEEVLSNYKSTFPISTLVINDNYIFDKYEISRNTLNLKSLISALIPSRLKCEIHVLINFFNADGKITQATFDAIVVKLQIELSNSSRSVRVTILTHNRKDIYHNRYVFTNYFMIKSQNGFNGFDESLTLSRFHDNDVELRSYFFSMDKEDAFEYIKFMKFFTALKSDWDEFPVKSKLNSQEFKRAGYHSNRLIESFRVNTK